MVTKALLVALLVGAASLADAACPNACSGHGSCGNYDACTCYADWEGADCSMRVCQYDWAWVTTPQGDLNYDGDRFDGTKYVSSYPFTQPPSASYVKTDAAPGGTWEAWPSFFAASADEGHFYMECSNRGVCDRESGLCKCFDGYEGEACRRQTCEKDCNGHGRCVTVEQLLKTYNFDNSASRTYTLWDSDKSRTCVCDAGYIGASCDERECPRGDDPLTADLQTNDVQIVEIYSGLIGTGSGDLGGTATFTYTDPYGNEYTTDPVSIVKYDGPTTAVTTMISAVSSAFTSLPNNVVPSISVTAGFCEQPLSLLFSAFDEHSSSGHATNLAAGAVKAMRCPDATNAGDIAGYIVAKTDDLEVLVHSTDWSGTGGYSSLTPTATAVANSAVDTCTLLDYHECVRFFIEFTGNAGAQAKLKVDDTLVTRNSKTQSQDATGAIGSAVHYPTHVFGADAATTFAYRRTSTQTTTQAAIATGGYMTANQILFQATTESPAGIYPPGAKIDVYCNSRYLGIYTVSAYAETTGPISVTETIIQDNNPCFTDNTAIPQVKLRTQYLITNTNFAGFGLEGKKIKFGDNTFDGIDLVIDSIPTYEKTGAREGQGYIFLKDTTADLGVTSDVSAGARTLIIDGAATKENSECADRGLCDRETGSCKCFKGYTGLACETQNALSA